MQLQLSPRALQVLKYSPYVIIPGAAAGWAYRSVQYDRQQQAWLEHSLREQLRQERQKERQLYQIEKHAAGIQHHHVDAASGGLPQPFQSPAPHSLVHDPAHEPKHHVG